MYPLLMEPNFLNTIKDNPDCRIFDATQFERLQLDEAQLAFKREHIPNSFQLLFRYEGKVLDIYSRKPLSSDVMNKILTNQGFSRGIFVVLYDRDGYSASRVWWLLNYYSHTSVSILEGGFDNYKRLFPIVVNQRKKPVLYASSSFCCSINTRIFADIVDVLVYCLNNQCFEYSQLLRFYPQAERLVPIKVKGFDAGEPVAPFKQVLDFRSKGSTPDLTKVIPNIIRIFPQQLLDFDGIRRNSEEIRNLMKDFGVNYQQKMAVIADMQSSSQLILTLALVVPGGLESVLFCQFDGDQFIDAITRCSSNFDKANLSIKDLQAI